MRYTLSPANLAFSLLGRGSQLFAPPLLATVS